MMTVVQDKVSRRLLFVFAVLAAFAAAAQPVQSAEEEEIIPVVETLELKADTDIEAEPLVDVAEDVGPVIILQWC